MKILTILGLVLLVSCGGKKTESITVIGTKTYGGHTLTLYSDGSQEWTHPAGFVAIEDLDAHNAQAAQYVSDWNDNSSEWTTYTLVKSNTLMGKGWILVKKALDDGKSPYTEELIAFNMDNYLVDSIHSIPEDGMVVLKSIQRGGLSEVENGIYNFSNPADAVIAGSYNLTTEHSEKGIFALRESGITISHLIAPGTGVASALDASDLGVDGFDFATDFYLSQDLDSKKDLENIASVIETEELTQYGLSTKTAKMIKTLAKTAGKRALTVREKDLFAKELTGMSFDKAAEMMVEDYDGLLEKAAELNETSPEAIKELINTIM